MINFNGKKGKRVKLVMAIVIIVIVGAMLATSIIAALL